MAVLTQLQEEAVQEPVRFFFKAPQQQGLHITKQKLQVTVLACKAGTNFEEIQQQEITISEKPNVVPGFFVARHVRLHFAGGAWPQVDGKALSLCVGVVKVWRLAPPLFRQRFLEIFRKLERKAKKAHSISAVPRFWSTAVHGQSFNMVINMDLVRRLQKSHDFKGDDLRALLKMAVKDKKEFHVLHTDEAMALRQRIFAKGEDARECTFHPQAAANVPKHVLDVERFKYKGMDPDIMTDIDDFLKDIGTNYEGHKYPKYRVHRLHLLSQAKTLYYKGALNDALTKLKSSFGVQQILDRFRCHHEGCGQKLDKLRNLDKCKFCSGFYCGKHEAPAVHRCQKMKEIIRAKAKKEAAEEMNADKSRPPEENFDNKVEFGLLLEARELAEKIISDLEKKEKQKNHLEHLGQSLASFGAVRLLERPFRRQICQSVLERRRAASEARAARFGCHSASARDFNCKCPKAHSPSELRFPAAESVPRRLVWVKQAIHRAVSKSDVRPGSSAERSKIKKENEKKPPPPPLPPSEGPDARGRTRKRSKPRARLQLQKRLEEKAADLQHAFGLCCEARVKLEENLAADAQQLVQQAKHLSEESLKEALAAMHQLGDFAEVENKAFRDCEKQELQQMQVSLQKEAQEMLELCEMLEEEVQMLQEQLKRPPPLPSSAYSGQPSPPPRPPTTPPRAPVVGMAGRIPPSPSVVKALQDDAALMRLLVNAGEIRPPDAGQLPGKTQMCIDFLEAGRCDMELNCPFAHNPDELSGYQSFQRSDQHVHPEACKNQALRSPSPPPPMRSAGHLAADPSAAADDAFLRYLIDMGRASPSGARRW